MTIPAGTYAVSTQLSLKSRVSVQGAGADQTVLVMPAQPSRTYMLYAVSLSEVTISGLTFRAGGYTDNVSGLFLPGAHDCKASNLRFEGLVYGMKLGSGSVATGWEVSDIVVRDTEMPMYISATRTISSSPAWIGRRCVSIPRETTPSTWSGNNRDLTFNDCSLSGGSGYCLHLYMEDGSSSGITFNNLSLDATTGRYPLVISAGYSDAPTFTKSTFVAGPDGEVIRFYGGRNVTFPTASLPPAESILARCRPVNNIVLRNGFYTGEDLGSGVTFENVTAGATITTTLAPTNTTTMP